MDSFMSREKMKSSIYRTNRDLFSSTHSYIFPEFSLTLKLWDSERIRMSFCWCCKDGEIHHPDDTNHIKIFECQADYVCIHVPGFLSCFTPNASCCLRVSPYLSSANQLLSSSSRQLFSFVFIDRFCIDPTFSSTRRPISSWRRNLSETTDNFNIKTSSFLVTNVLFSSWSALVC